MYGSAEVGRRRPENGDQETSGYLGPIPTWHRRLPRRLEAAHIVAEGIQHEKLTTLGGSSWAFWRRSDCRMEEAACERQEGQAEMDRCSLLHVEGFGVHLRWRDTLKAPEEEAQRQERGAKGRAGDILQEADSQRK